jgi:hypothetical protein
VGVKDFTGQQKDTDLTQQARGGDLKCNKCSRMVQGFGIEAGDTCRQRGATDPGSALGSTNVPNLCGGKFFKVNKVTADNMKRRSDGAA